MKLKPMSHYILIEPIKEEEKTKGGIFLPQTSDKKRPDQGIVIAISPKTINSSVKNTETEIKKGDKVLFNRYGKHVCHEVEMNGKEYLILQQEDILAIVE